MEERNKLDGLIYSTEKSLSEFGEKLDAESKTAVETALEEAKKALEAEDVETLKAAYEALTAVSHKLAEEMYKKASEEAEAAGGENPEQPSADDVVDADFEEVD